MCQAQARSSTLLPFYKRTINTKGAWKCNIPLFKEIMTYKPNDQPTNQPINRQTRVVIGMLHYKLTEWQEIG